VNNHYISQSRELLEEFHLMIYNVMQYTESQLMFLKEHVISIFKDEEYDKEETTGACFLIIWHMVKFKKTTL
jgi:hypothetical protein